MEASVDLVGARDHLWPSPDVRDKLIDLIPLKRCGREDEIANAAIFLVSDYADSIDGEVLVVDGYVVEQDHVRSQGI